MSVPLAANAAAAPTLAAMKWHDRVLLVAAPNADDPALMEQRRLIAEWQAGADERDLRLVTLVDGKVSGAADAPAVLARKHHLAGDRFTAVLIGKDGGEKLRADKPFTADQLRETIDAMPMRQGGGR